VERNEEVKFFLTFRPVADGQICTLDHLPHLFRDRQWLCFLAKASFFARIPLPHM
jgi:hypothetical protein